MDYKKIFTDYLLKPACYVAVLLVAIFILNKISYFNISLGSNNNYNSFEVIGTGKVTATPNIGQTTFTIDEKGTTQSDAKNNANKKQNQAIKDLEALGVKKADIKTTGFYVNPNYEDVTVLSYPAPATRTQNGYIATITTTVKSNKIDTINKAIDKLTALGMNVGGVEYTFADRQQYQNEAQDKAIANAREQAQNMAKAAGFKLGKIVSIRNADDQMGYQPYGADMSTNKEVVAPSAPTDLQPGSNEIVSKIGVTYYIQN